MAKILVVDDNTIGREVLCTALEQEGYEVTGAANGLEALQLADKLLPDLVLLDVMMPGIDGFQVCRSLRENPILAEVPVIMITALATAEARLSGIEAGADDFIAKPIDLIELQARVRTITRLNRYRRLMMERAKFEWALERSDEGYLLIDGSDKLIYANPQARRYLSLREDASLSEKNFGELVSDHYHCEPKDGWRNWPQPGTLRYLVRPESASSLAVWLQVETHQLPSGDAENYLIHIANVTSKAALQNEVVKFNHAVQHKLRTPLTGLIGSLELLKELLEDQALDVTRLTELALQSANRLNHEIEDIIQYLTIPKLLKPGEGFSLSSLIPLFIELSKRTGVKLPVFNFEEDLKEKEIPLSSQAMELICQELLDNSKKFHATGDPIINISLKSLDENRVKLTFINDGFIISPDELPHVWSPYKQLEKYFTGQIAGMGLGLSKIALLIWGIGGSGTICNREDDQGVIVELSLPVR